MSNMPAAKPELYSSNLEEQQRAQAISYEIEWLEHQIRTAERDYHSLVKKAAWSDDDCAEADGITLFIANARQDIAYLMAHF
jgi:hypothetical protein